MAINTPKGISITVHEVDANYLSKQHGKLCDVLNNSELDISSKQREALVGLKSLVKEMLIQANVPVKKGKSKSRITMTAELVNSGKDLLNSDFSTEQVAEKLGISKSTVEKISNGGFNDKFSYKPTEYLSIKL